MFRVLNCFLGKNRKKRTGLPSHISVPYRVRLMQAVVHWMMFGRVTPVVGSETINAVVEETPVAIGAQESADENVEVLQYLCGSKRASDFKSCRAQYYIIMFW